jgi:predicted PurR-regulated permease PerM
MDRGMVLKLEKWAIWGSVLAIILLLRHLFPAIFLTFVLSYIANTAVKALSKVIPTRRLSVVLVYAVLVAALAGALTLVVPRIIMEAGGLARQIITTEAEQSDLHEGVVPADVPEGRTVVSQEVATVIDAQLIRLVGQDTFESFRRTDAYAAMVDNMESTIGQIGPRVAQAVRVFVNGIFTVGMQFIVSMILSFLVVWDLPAIAARFSRFAEGRTAEVYAEIAPGAKAFGVVMGRAFEAQTVVAVVNTLLSCIGFSILGLPSISLLATIVFFCSYIPVFGMILSTLPAAVLAFRVGGFTLILWVVVTVAIVHAVEAYMLNPLIYGRHMKMHPLMIIVVLLIGEHVFGVWGLLLAVPVSAFAIKYLIEGAEFEEAETAPPTTVGSEGSSGEE